MKGVTKWAKSELMNLGRDAIRRFEGKWVSRGGRIPFPRAETWGKTDEKTDDYERGLLQ